MTTFSAVRAIRIAKFDEAQRLAGEKERSRQGDNLRHWTPVTCPYCQREMRPGAGFNSHTRTCLHNPELFAAVRKVLAGADGLIIAHDAYDRIRGALPSAGSLRAQCEPDSWPSVAKRFGLTARVKMLALDVVAEDVGPEMDAAIRQRWEMEEKTYRVEGVQACRITHEDRYEVRYMLR